jgi:hypothetical protein
MAEAKRDNNFITTLLAVSNADEVTPVVLWADPTTHRLLVDYARGVTSVTNDATPNPNSDTDDLYDLTACTEASAFQNPTGTPGNGQKMIIRIKADGAYALTWGTAYTAGGVSLPTITVANKIIHVGLIYNTANSLNKWMCVAVVTEA